MAQRLHGDGHEDTLSARLALARILRAGRKLQEAEQMLRGSLPQARAQLGDGDSTTIVVARGLATVLEEQRRFQDALAVRREELARTARVLGDHDVFVATGLAELGEHGLARGRFNLAQQYFLQALAVRRRLHPPGHWRIDEARGRVGRPAGRPVGWPKPKPTSSPPTTACACTVAPRPRKRSPFARTSPRSMSSGASRTAPASIATPSREPAPAPRRRVRSPVRAR